MNAHAEAKPCRCRATHTLFMEAKPTSESVLLAKIGLVCVWLGESKYPECSIFKAGTGVRAANFECICSAGRRPVLGVDDPQVDVSEASTEEMSEGNFSLNFSFHTFVYWYIAISNYVSSTSGKVSRKKVAVILGFCPNYLLPPPPNLVNLLNFF